MNTRILLLFVAVVLGIGAILTLRSTGVSGDSSSANFPPAPEVVDQQLGQATEQEEPADDSFALQQASDEEEVASRAPIDQWSADEEEREVLALIAEMEGSRPAPLEPLYVQMVQRFVREGVDADWSGSTENQILATIAEVQGIPATSIDVECRSTMCRLRISHPPSEPTGPEMTGESIMEIIQRSSLSPLWMAANQDELGNPISQAFFQRGNRDTTQPIEFVIKTDP